jgi:hypothetical protein
MQRTKTCLSDNYFVATKSLHTRRRPKARQKRIGMTLALGRSINAAAAHSGNRITPAKRGSNKRQ